MSAARIRIELALWAAPFALAALFMAANAFSASLEDYGRLPSLEDAAISPDGSHLAYVRTDGDERIVALVSLPDRRPLGAFKIGAERLRSTLWADNDRLLVCTSMLYAPVLATKTDRMSSQQVTPSAMDPSGGGKSASASSAGLGIPIVRVGHQVSVKRDWSLLQVYDLITHTSTSLPDPAKLRALPLMNVIAGQAMVRQVDGHSVVFVPGIYVTNPAMGDFYDESNLLQPALIRVDLDTGAVELMLQSNLRPQNREGIRDSVGGLRQHQLDGNRMVGHVSINVR